MLLIFIGDKSSRDKLAYSIVSPIEISHGSIRNGLPKRIFSKIEVNNGFSFNPFNLETLFDKKNDLINVLYHPLNDVDVWELEKQMDEIIRISKSEDILIITNNVLLLNWLEDYVALESVYLFSMCDFGCRHHDKISIIKYFTMDGIREKLEHLSPGEVFLDTDNKKIIDELRSFHNNRFHRCEVTY